MTQFRSLSLVVALLFVASGHAYGLAPPNDAKRTPAPRPQNSAVARSVDCSTAYGGKPAKCRHITCPKLYLEFIGVWKGTFHAYARKLSTSQNIVYRPYSESISYKKSDCLRNIKSGETFIVGHETSHYPKFRDLPPSTQKDLLIIGKDAHGTSFLRRVGDEGTYRYTLAYKNEPASLSIWKLSLAPSNGQPAMTFTTIDAKDFTKAATQTRDVTITLAVGPSDKPYWQGVIAYGSHTHQEK